MAGEGGSFFRMDVLWPTLFLYSFSCFIALGWSTHRPSLVGSTQAAAQRICDWIDPDTTVQTVWCLQDARFPGSASAFFPFPISCTHVFISFLKRTLFFQRGSLYHDEHLGLYIFSCKYKWLPFFIPEIHF